ncbi:uncharacterized protein LOC114750935 isoform X2 [Neltuma alba]|uniref:uncharacterized protein LOC114750935 isoform X2 n=1 Tax=Neltuma alba TaxID=207710 RepID=UPI0010A3AF43|nr:uncharacterized protein LOC114750935 isoform X2 [Prosopis alba]
MGGGGVLRTAAKVAGVGVASSGLRGVPVAPPAEQSIRKASRPASAVLSSEGAKSAAAAPLHAVESWDSDEWDFAHDDGLVMEAGEPTPRVVFGEVPSFQEAKAAASELKNAIDEVYLSSDSSVCEGSTGSEVSVRSPVLSRTETKSCVVEAISTPSMPKHALQAFKLLSTNSEAQNLVASVASDPNVWSAIMQNPSLKDFLQSNQTATGVESGESPEILEKLHHSDQKDNQGNGFLDFMEIMQNFKVTVTEMVSNVSTYFNNLFGLSEAEKTSSGANGNTRTSFMDPFAMGGTLMGLAVLVIMVVLLKRA